MTKHFTTGTRSAGASPGAKYGVGNYGERGVRAYSGGLGAEPPAGSNGRAPGQGTKPPWSWKVCHWNTQTRGKSCHFRIQLVSIPYRLLSHRIWAILVTRLDVVGVRCAPVTTLLPLLVSSSQKARGCGNGMDNGLFLPHCTVMAWIGTGEGTLQKKNIFFSN